MGKLKVIKSGSMITIQDYGRFGYRKFGIPQSGAMDLAMMKKANFLVGNAKGNPVIEFALLGMKLEAIEDTVVGVVGAMARLENRMIENVNAQLIAGDVIEVFAPKKMYAYLAIGGMIKAKSDFGSYSTYLAAGFGGIGGRALKSEDTIDTVDDVPFISREISQGAAPSEITTIRIEKGPEWNLLQEFPEKKIFAIDSASNRVGIRLTGATLKCERSEIASSAVIPGTIQLPANGQPIILMNDCQTTGGYPRIGKVIEEDMGKLAQVSFHGRVQFVMI